MTVLLVIFLVILSIMLGGLILLQRGKGDMGLGSIARGGQLLFGGSGGQDVFEKATWVLGAVFIGAALLLALWKAPANDSRLRGYRAPVKAAIKLPVAPQTPPVSGEAASQPTSTEQPSS